MELSEVKGIGPKRIEALHQAGIFALSDLLAWYPTGYLDYSACSFAVDLQDGETASVQVKISSQPGYYARKGLTTVTVYGKDPAGKTVALRFFNQPYRAKSFQVGETYIASGRVHRGEKGAPALMNPVISRELRGIVPVYTLPEGMTQSVWRAAMEASLQNTVIDETLPEGLIKKHTLLPRRETLFQLHFPQDREKLEEALRRRNYELALLYFLATHALQEERGRKKGIAFSAPLALPEYLAKLPFTPTEAQLRVLKEIARDMAEPKPMNRLVEGDVGSGKTAVALFTLYAAAKDGYQGVIMAPTEILARQHFETLKTVFGSRCGLLLGSSTPAEKRAALEKLSSGEWQAVTGTHALFSKSVRFHRLGLVVTDEQHRFGVAQRAAMEHKGLRPDVLVMSATPIPRTLALILFGDLDLSVIDQMPAGRKPILTHLVGQQKRKDMYRYLGKLARQGQQSYVVCPLIEKTEGLEGLSVDEVYEEVAALVGSVRVEKLHGRMSEGEKQAVMDRFYGGQTSILISTTVIEVGVHVPKATSMVIEGAERFGLSAMHQLRGRVGRGEDQAHCYLVVYEQKKTAMERVQAMLQTADGFAIAQRDLQLRGAGDLMGLRQAGEEREQSFLKDCPLPLLETAAQDAREVWNLPTVENNTLVDLAVRRFGTMENIALN
ncbi:MAG: ATP-dependent DNA helicase RecG [Clostridia bacterium]|nr:ATP-dependent DNA helicase RecG [Clostridia bacterium]